MYDELEIFENEENYFKILDELIDYGSSHNDMHQCFERALELTKRLTTIDYSENEQLIKELLLEILEELVMDGIEDFISHRWEFTEYTTEEFVRLLNAPIGALECTRNRFLGDIHPWPEYPEIDMRLIQ
jgi:hypothetical protein